MVMLIAPIGASPAGHVDKGFRGAATAKVHGSGEDQTFGCDRAHKDSIVATGRVGDKPLRGFAEHGAVVRHQHHGFCHVAIR
jgi:hypothetical protein